MSASPVPSPRLSARRFSLAREAAFCLRALRLVGAIFLEAIGSFVQFLVFPLRRRSERARVRAVILSWSRVHATVIVLALILSLAAGCQSTMPGSSFGKQVDELGWSAHELIRMDDALGSIQNDLEVLFCDPELDQLPETFDMLGW